MFNRIGRKEVNSAKIKKREWSNLGRTGLEWNNSELLASSASESHMPVTALFKKQTIEEG